MSNTKIELLLSKLLMQLAVLDDATDLMLTVGEHPKIVLEDSVLELTNYTVLTDAMFQQLANYLNDEAGKGIEVTINGSKVHKQCRVAVMKTEKGLNATIRLVRTSVPVSV